MKNYKYFSIITGIFSACLVISNILDTKFFQIGETAFPAGIILFPIVYVFGDVFTEVYGYSQSRKAIWTGFFSLLLMVIFFEIGIRLPAASFWEEQEAFSLVLGKIPRIVLASITAYFAGEFSNSYTMAKLKLVQKGKSMPVRFILSTLVGQFVDTSIFVAIAFAGTMSLKNMGIVLVSAWLFKVGWEVVALPVSVPVVKWLKKAENEDYYDKDTNFNPFKLS
jgi:queuosine precursor transporter